MKIKGLERCKCDWALKPHWNYHANRIQTYSIWRTGNSIEPYELYYGEIKHKDDMQHYIDCAFSLSEAVEKANTPSGRK